MFRPSAQKIDSEKKSTATDKKWTQVFFFNDWEEESVAEWVKLVAKQSGQDVRYSRFLGATHIDGSGDLEKIRDTIKSMLPMLNIVFYSCETTRLRERGEKTKLPMLDFVKEKDIEYWTNLAAARDGSVTRKTAKIG